MSSIEPRKITNMGKQTNKNLALSIKSIKKKLSKVISKQTLSDISDSILPAAPPDSPLSHL